ncbi:hypothetical protein SAMN05216302_100692 [Nitrosomonas aestuarii]|uniref:Uncharacterized protein n=1 Tax=Nitrosomonas aestuarii TaxID=52441 RepID=A0A1I3ZIP8_9PROT|nr:hypothetical protein [Nitrosomonas aestuarii]SFK43466.1 hypothetical protein SAMN05216302_100692 [Nitrosomonas aestuarii]
MLEIIIAILLIYALFASLVSGINEMIVQIFAMRGRILFEGIVMMLGELPKETGAGIKSWFRKAKHKLGFGVDQNAHLTKSLYEHPLIDTLSPPGGSRPSYISASTFSTALVQVLTSDGSFMTLSQKLDNRTTSLGKLLGPMLDEANGDLEKFKAKVESHFNAVMDRVGGWYKRRAQVVIFLIGLVLASVLNVDSIYIAQQLQRNPAQVETLVQAAERLSLKADEVERNLPSFRSNNLIDEDSDATGQRNSIDDDFLKEVQKINHKIDEFKHLGLPIGWNLSEKSDSLLLPHQDVRFFWLGWLLTALAGALGAPFWFDAISKLFAVRGTGKKPE